MDKINIHLTETTEHFFIKYSYVALYKTASAATSLERVSNELAVTWLHYACMIWKRNVRAANIALIWDTDSTGVNLFATPHLSRVRTYICIYMSCVYMCVWWMTCTYQAVLGTISWQLGGRKQHPPMISLSDDARGDGRRPVWNFRNGVLLHQPIKPSTTLALSIGVYVSLRIQHSRDNPRHGDRERRAHRPRRHQRDFPRRRSERDWLDARRSPAQPPTRFVVKCAPHTISTGPELRAITCQSLTPHIIIFHAPTS